MMSIYFIAVQYKYRPYTSIMYDPKTFINKLLIDQSITISDLECL